MTQWLEPTSWPQNPLRDVPFKVRHLLDGHPLLTIESLLELSKRLAPEHFLYNRGTLSRFTDRRDVTSNGLTPQETLEQIRNNESWIVLKHVEKDPVYRALLDEVLDEVEAAFGPQMAGMHQRENYIFVTSPGSVTPLHMDPEHNILFQIQGWKEFHAWDPSRDVLPDELLERFYTAENHKDIQLSPIDQVEPATFRLDPGDGLHVPLEAPHWVQNGDEVSISFSTSSR